MTYQPYLIANYATGVTKRLQPWLNPDDAQEELFDGYVYRGTLSKRQGYTYFATGDQGGFPYRESRIVHTLVTVPAAEVPDGVLLTFTLAGTAQLARGSVRVQASNPLVLGGDDGEGLMTGTGITTGSVDYITGAISVTFAVAPVALSTVTFTYSFYPDDPVMMIATFFTASNVQESIVASTQYVNYYDSTTNTYQDISPASAYNGDNKDFFTWVNYPDASNNPRLLFANNVDPIQQYDGTVVTDYVYTSAEFTDLTCSWMTQMKGRLILLRTTEDGTVKPLRIRISGTGANCDVFDTSATGAGVIDIPDGSGSWIYGADFNRDDLIIFTQNSTWVMSYTGNDTTPFVLKRIDESRGCQATFSAITYLNRTTAASPRGLIITDGYRVERQDEDIPDFTYDEVDPNNFELCFAGSVDADRDHYLIYPTPAKLDEEEVFSKRILVTNYEEDNYAQYRIPLSCMGTYLTSFDITWDDLSPVQGINNWDEFAAEYENWNAIAYTKGQPITLGGGHHGEIWQLNTKEGEDNPVNIYDITVIDATTVEVTTDWNNFEGPTTYDPDMGADYIFLSGLVGMTELNEGQYPILEKISNNVFRLSVTGSYIPATSFSAYVSGGKASRVIPFNALFKQFNPFIEQDKKVRCGWLYMYVDSTGTSLLRKVAISNIDLTDPLFVIVTTQGDNGFEPGDLITFNAIVGTVELNNFKYYITPITSDSFLIEGLDATGYTPYVSSGYAGVEEKAKMDIQIIRDDVEEPTQLDENAIYPYEGTCTNLVFEDGFKKWYKVYINQTGRFIQFRLRNRQAGANINVQATMPGFQPVGRII